MKKLLSFILIISILTLTAVSCNKDDHTVETPTLTPDAPTAADTRYTITAQQWADALALNNYTATISQSYTENLNGRVSSSESSVTVISTPAAAFVKEVREDSQNEIYYVFDDGVTYHVSDRGDGIYEPQDVTNGCTNCNIGQYFHCSSISFEDLIYNENAKAYVFSVSNSEGATMSYAFYFVDGQLVKIVGLASESYSDNNVRASIEQSASATISSHGATTLTVPEFEVSGD